MFRNPTVTTRQIATVDRISGGRVIPGMGSGYATSEFVQFGSPPWRQWQRVKALAEAIDIMAPMLAGEVVTYEGQYFQARGAMCAPPPLRCPPPLLVGGAGDTTLRAAAKHATIWNNPPLYEGALVENYQRLQRFCAEVGRDPADITVSARCRVAIATHEADARKGLDAMAAGVNAAAAKSIEDHGLWGAPERICEVVRDHMDKGCTFFIMDFYGDREESEELFAREVLPEFR